MQIPQGPADRVCPFHRRPMSKVCHTCPMWTLVRGKDPQSTEDVDQWNCALAWLPMMMINVAQQSRQTGASCDKVATEIKKFHDNMAKQNNQMHQLLTGPRDDREAA